MTSIKFLSFALLLLSFSFLSCNDDDKTKSVQVSVVSSDNDRGTVSGSGIYNVGSECTVKATCNNNYTFDGWYISDNYPLENFTQSLNPEYTFTVRQPIQFTALFNPKGLIYLSILEKSTATDNSLTYWNSIELSVELYTKNDNEEFIEYISDEDFTLEISFPYRFNKEPVEWTSHLIDIKKGEHNSEIKVIMPKNITHLTTGGIAKLSILNSNHENYFVKGKRIILESYKENGSLFHSSQISVPEILYQ